MKITQLSPNARVAIVDGKLMIETSAEHGTLGIQVRPHVLLTGQEAAALAVYLVSLPEDDAQSLANVLNANAINF